DNVDYELPEKPFEFRGPMPLGFRQVPVDRWPASRLYNIEYATEQDAKTLSPMTPLRITLRRKADTETNRRTGEQYMKNPALEIKRIEDREGRTVPSARLRMRLQTIGQQEGYWLDTGILLG
ncbi:MAG: virulence factor SrfB, partial [Variovorax sp.]